MSLRKAKLAMVPPGGEAVDVGYSLASSSELIVEGAGKAGA